MRGLQFHGNPFYYKTRFPSQNQATVTPPFPASTPSLSKYLTSIGLVHLHHLTYFMNTESFTPSSFAKIPLLTPSCIWYTLRSLSKKKLQALPLRQNRDKPLSHISVLSWGNLALEICQQLGEDAFLEPHPRTTSKSESFQSPQKDC